MISNVKDSSVSRVCRQLSDDSLSCQHDGNITLIIPIMYILCHIYLSVDNMMSYNRIHDSAQLDVTILITHPEL